jgi:mono/diheme cytochrome c family protein
MKLAVAVFLLSVSCAAQNLSQGEEVFAKSCSTGYCHGLSGVAGGAPRLAGRGFDLTYINGVVRRGIPDTAMMAFTGRLSPAELNAVVAYVAGLNGVAAPTTADSPSVAPALTGDAARGSRLFREALRGFERCSTCHEVGGFGMPVAAPITKVPATAAQLRSLATPNVKTGVADGESMPVLVLSNGRQSTVFYDLTSLPPVQRSVESNAVKFTEGSAWRHASVTKAYTDAEVESILSYLRAVIKSGQ